MARKSKAFGEILKQERTNKSHQKRLEKLQQKIREGPLGDKFANMVTNPKGGVKMSEVLEEFVEPYLAFIDNSSERENLLKVAVTAWNLALIPENARQSRIDDFIKVGFKGNDPLAQQYTREILDELIARKLELFAKNTRFIIDFQLEDTGKEFHISVASTLLKPIVSDSAD
ncbi:hypothetical protein [Laspinema olomoucense]|uniref:hypothetical protein n=1 Tax=Laspinema olomoucense TaxID=3231600 RepID=UPI0021BB7F24|nr:hypothetical protein [Laspinema sp. D3d]MCT7973656.1 hypothetical protein [Laspinema sp. D3d]